MTTEANILDPAGDDAPATKPEVPRRMLDDRCKHGFLEALCWHACCRNFSGRRAASSTPQISEGTSTPKPEGEPRAPALVDRPSPAPKDPAADSALRLPNRDGEARLLGEPAAVDPARRLAGAGSGEAGCQSGRTGRLDQPRRTDTARVFVGVQLSLPFASTWLAAPPQALNALAVPTRITRIVDTVCAVYGVTRAQLWGKDRHRTIASARILAMGLARECTGLSFPELGRVFGNRDHTTVMSACKRVARGPRDGFEAERWAVVRDALNVAAPPRPLVKVRVLDVTPIAEIA